MRILYVVAGRYPTNRAYGIQISKTVEALRDLGAQVEIKSPPSLIWPIIRLGKFGFLLRTLIFSNYIKLVWLFGKVVGRKYDCVYTRDPQVAWELSFVRAKVYLELHDIPESRYIFKRAIKSALGIIVISKGLKKALIDMGVSESKILVAPDAVDIKDFDIQVSKEVARQEFGLPQDKKIVLYAGLFDEWKGYRTLLEASKLLEESVLLVMAGGREEQVKSLSKEFPMAKFLGWTDYSKLPLLQKCADVLVLPNSAKFEISRLYTSPLKLFAYMASLVPIVASDLPSIREVLDDTMAVLVAPDDPQALAQTIAHVLNNTGLAKTKAEKAFGAVRDYTWKKRAKNILDFISG